ncbi:MAG: enoyl-CoA hydratase/isomerase family protein, partial [Pararheinheimera sp.]|nr:enoyl-CoA hydratase/isomerase family protein [Rheinheimera sp.]
MNQPVSNTQPTFSLSIRPDQIGVISMDVAGESMNVLKAAFADEIKSLLGEIKNNKDIKGLVIIGADISMLDGCTTAQQAEDIGRMGQLVFNQLEALSIPLVAAIHGPCLGGGLELALACHARVATTDNKTVLGLPEVQLGLLPGSGGTQRLPRLVGVEKALDMILTGKQLRAAQAKKIGLVDAVVPKSILLEAAVQLALKGKPAERSPKLSFISQVLQYTSIGRYVLFSQAEKQTLVKTHGNYPAPLKILKAIKAGVDGGFNKGLDVEAKAFGEL